MKSLALVLVLSGVLTAVLADLPVECHYEDIEGDWLFQETARDGGPKLNCTELGAVKFEKRIQLRFPNTAEDEYGNVGTWTMVYDQGFEVTVGGRSYFAFSYFTKNGRNVTSYCASTFPGWSRDLTVRNWSCFKGTKVGKTVPKPRTRSTFLQIHELGARPYVQQERFVSSINRHQSKWSAAIYPQFDNMTLTDIFRMRGGQAVRKSQKLVRNQKSSLDTALRVSMLPKSWDWRNVSGVNYVRPVRNQGSCGSCYAFASVGVIESQLLINSAGKEGLFLSPQDVVQCSTLSQGCDGGFPYIIAGRYAQDQGFVSETCSPYNPLSPSCTSKRDSCRHVYTTSYKYVGGYFGACNEEEMMLALVQNGPLAVGIEVYDDFLQYKSGIYHHTQLADAFNPLEVTNHAVLLVGYGVTPHGDKYWIVQNSWGTGWGMDGYVFIRRGTDEIAVESMAVQAIAYP